MNASTVLTILAITSHTLGLPLRPSDFSNHGHIVHYHRDASGAYIPHIHYRSGNKISQFDASGEAHSQGDGAPIDSVAVYDVPRDKHFSTRERTHMALRLRTLVENSDVSNSRSNSGNFINTGSQKPHSVQSRDVPSPEVIEKATSLPLGLQFLNSQTNRKQFQSSSYLNKPSTELPPLNLKSLLGGLILSTTQPSVSKADILDLGTLLGDLHSSGSAESLVHSHGHSHDGLFHSHVHSHAVSSGTNDPSTSETSHNLFRGLFNQQGSDQGHESLVHGHGHSHSHPEVATLKPPTTKTFYRKSTVHNKPITKRGIADTDISSYPKTFIDNILNIRIRNTSPASVERVRFRNKYFTTPATLDSQFERLSGINLAAVRRMNREQQRKLQALRSTIKPKLTKLVETPTQKELVQLQGIHIMFSNGHQDFSNKVPTIHLTAALSDNINHIVQAASSAMNVSQQGADLATSITDKITGTAVIRNGHLYLVIYPFGHNKSLELHLNESVSRISLPKNKALPRIKAHSSVLVSTVTSTPSTTDRTTTEATTPSSEGLKSGTHEHAHAHSSNQHHHGHLPDLQLAEVKDTMLQTLLAPIDRFMSPWKAINFSKVLPYMHKNHSQEKTNREEDKEIDFVTFIAKASDPFDRIKTIIQSLANTSLLNTTSNSSAPEAKFNFELKLQQPPTAANKENQTSNQLTVENNSKEVSDTNVNLQTTKTPETATEPTVTVSGFSIEQPRFDSNYPYNTTPSRSSFDQTVTERNKPNQINMSNYMTRPTTDLPSINYQTTISEQQDKHKIGNLRPINANDMKIDTNRGGQAEQTAQSDTKSDFLLHVSENVVAATTTVAPRKSTDLNIPMTTLAYFPNYTLRSNVNQRPTGDFVTRQPLGVSRQTVSASRPSLLTRSRTTLLGSNLQSSVSRNPSTIVQNTGHQQTNVNGYTEPLMSLADILNDIRRIQLHNMHQFNIHNNNFNAMLLSESQQQPVSRTPVVVEGPIYPETSTRTRGRQTNEALSNNVFRNFRPHFQQQSIVTPFPTTVRRRLNERAALRNALDAMLVLSVDDILADQTTLHGAIVLSHRTDTSSSSNNK